jgi:hypothetical protein
MNVAIHSLQAASLLDFRLPPFHMVASRKVGFPLGRFCDAAFASKKVPESLREGFPTGEPIAMKRLALVLVFSGLAITGAAAGSNLSSCLDPATKLAAGGDVTNEEITAARQACAQLQQPGLDRNTSRRIEHAESSLSDEQKRRQAH